MPRLRDLHKGPGTRTFLDAMHSGKVHLARFILDALDGRIIDSKTEESRTPLMFAMFLPDSGTRLKFAQLLLQKGANVNCRDGQGRTALSLACELGHLDLVKLLVQYSADPEISDTRGNSALMHAARQGHCQVLQFLVWSFRKLGLRLDHTNLAGQTVVQVASIFGNEQCVQALCTPERKREVLGVCGGREQGEPCQELIQGTFTKLSSNRRDYRLPEMFQTKLRIKEGKRPGTGNGAQCRSMDIRDLHLPLIHQQLTGLATGDECCAPAERTALSGASGHSTEVEQGVWGQGTEIEQETTLVWGEAESFKLKPFICGDQPGDPCNTSLSDRGMMRRSTQPGLATAEKAQCQDINTCPEDSVSISIASTVFLISESSAPLENETILRSSVNLSPSLSLQPEQPDFLREEVLNDPVRIHRTLTGPKPRLPRRFTLSESPRPGRKVYPDSKDGKERMSRSETFPLLHLHKKVSTQTSMGSISGVRCEFDCISNNVFPDA